MARAAPASQYAKKAAPPKALAIQHANATPKIMAAPASTYVPLQGAQITSGAGLVPNTPLEKHLASHLASALPGLLRVHSAWPVQAS